MPKVCVQNIRICTRRADIGGRGTSRATPSMVGVRNDEPTDELNLTLPLFSSALLAQPCVMQQRTKTSLSSVYRAASACTCRAGKKRKQVPSIIFIPHPPARYEEMLAQSKASGPAARCRHERHDRQQDRYDTTMFVSSDMVLAADAVRDTVIHVRYCSL